MAKMEPLSRMPRRLPRMISPTKATQISTRHGWSDGRAEVIAATPAETLTATVSV